VSPLPVTGQCATENRHVTANKNRIPLEAPQAKFCFSNLSKIEEKINDIYIFVREMAIFIT